MAGKDGWPRAGRTPAETPAGRCPVPRRYSKNSDAAVSIAAVTVGRTRAGWAPDARDMLKRGISNGARPLAPPFWPAPSFVLEVPRREARAICGGFHIGRVIRGSTG
jgi:hypothetical protein